MIRKAVNLALMCAFYLPSLAQTKAFVEWERTPVTHAVPDAHKKESAVIIQDNRNIDYVTEGKDLVVYRSLHRIVKVQDDKGVEAFNKVSVPVGVMGMESIKARTITKSNQVFEVSSDKIKKTKNDNGRDVYLVAFEGVEKDAEIEILYTERRQFSIFGMEEFLYSIPVLSATFTMSSPSPYRFETKGYGGFPTATDTLIDGRYGYSAKTTLEGAEQEKYSNYQSLSPLLSYRLSYVVTENPDVRLFTWQDLIKKIHARYYDFSDKDKRATERFLVSIGVRATDNEEEKTRKIEDAIKNTINISKELDDEEYGRLDKVLDEKVTTEFGVVKLYACCFNLANVKHEIGLTSDRYEGVVDEDFESWHLLREFAIYFPNQDKYMAPISVYFRCPMIPSSFLGNKGIFCKTTSVGNITSAIPDIREIPSLPAEVNTNDILASVSFDPGEMEPQVEITNSFSGYSAAGLRELAKFVTKDRERELVQEILHIADKPENILSYKISDIEFQNYYTNTSLKFSARLKAPQLIEKAGNKYLFKIGEIIGNQQELYQTAERKFPIDLPFPHSLSRTIVVDIPQGYKVMNPETLNIHAEGKSGNEKPTMAFHSNYRFEDGKLSIDIKEYYSELHYAIEEYQAFTKVINAAADFNKVVLVLVKE